MIRRVRESLRLGCGRDERGGVAAEFAVTLPAVLLVLALAVGILSAQGQRVLLQDAAADAARLLARGEDAARASAAVAGAVPNAHMSSSVVGELVCVEASTPLRIGGATIEITARACALGGGL